MSIFVLFLLFIALVGLSYCLGKLISPTQVVEYKIRQVFLNIFWGSICIIFCFALFKSHFSSFYVVLFLPFCFYLFINRQNITLRTKYFLCDFKALFLLFPLIIFSFVYWLFFTVNIQDLTIKNAFYDYHLYSELARGLIYNGTESFYTRFYLLYTPHGTTLYHFFDIWLSAFISDIFKINTFDVLLLVVYPFFYLLTLLGIASFIEKKTCNVWFQMFGSILITFILAIDFSTISSVQLLKFSWISQPSNYFHLKVLCTYPFILCALHLFTDKKYNSAVFVLLILTTIYTTLLVSIIPALFIVSLYLYLKTKDKNNFFLILLYIISFVVHYTLFVDKQASITSGSIPVFVSFKTVIIVFIEYIIKNTFVYLSVFLAFVIVLKNNKLMFFCENKLFLSFAFLSLFLPFYLLLIFMDCAIIINHYIIFCHLSC